MKPLITEKSIADAKNGNLYTFLVDPKWGKYKIKEAVEKLFGVNVLSVRTARKKAFVKLAEKDKIDLFEASKK